MKKYIFIIAIITLSVAAYAATAVTQPLKPYHQDVAACIDCHGEQAPVKIKQVNCAECHGTGDDMAKLTTTLGYKNPHTSIHWGTTLPCEECHKEHRAPENYCADTCHYWPDMKTK